MAQKALRDLLRPKSFDEVVGQATAKRVLQTSMDNRCHYLFFGPSGTGKTTVARIVARAVQGPDFPMSDDPDVFEINAAQFSVNDMRELVIRTSTYPMTGKYRVVILDEAHQLSQSAQNLLLKPLEATNSATVFIICTTKLEKLIPPLVNRLTKIIFKPLTPEEMAQLVEHAYEEAYPLMGRLNFEGNAPLDAFVAEVRRQGLALPRNILNALESWYNGASAEEAVANEMLVTEKRD